MDTPRLVLSVGCLACALIAAGCASTPSAPDSDRPRTAAVRITSDRASVSGCSSVGIVSDDDLDDMRKKAARMGGDAVVLFAATPGARPGWFGPVITQVHTGEVYRCQR